MQVGSQDHVKLFCETFIATHQQFEPETLAWPELDAKQSELIRGIPFWQEVLYTEMRAISIIDGFCASVSNPQVRQAIELMAYEEHRHERLIRHLIQRYGIKVAQRDLEPLSGNVETCFIDFGYGECVDAFLGFGFFSMARQAKLFPEPLFMIFDLLMVEETRHVLLIVNWMAYRETSKGRGAAGLRALTSGWYHARAIASLLKTMLRNARQEGDGLNFSPTQASEFMAGFRVRRLLEECLAENTRRLAGYDERLLRPRFLPRLAKLALPLARLADRISAS